jgi:hypothetical protein
MVPRPGKTKKVGTLSVAGTDSRCGSHGSSVKNEGVAMHVDITTHLLIERTRR